MKRIGIIGAGRFGMSLAESLANAGGTEVLLIDRQRPAMQNASEFATALQGDATQLQVLEEAGFAECDVVVVAISSNIEASIMATANCMELNIPSVIAKASNELHGKILRRLGTDSVIYPNRDSARNLARSIASNNIVDIHEIADGYSIAEIDVPDGSRGKTLAEADLRRQFGVTVLCIRRAAEIPGNPRKVMVPQPEDTLQTDDKLIVFAETKKLNALP